MSAWRQFQVLRLDVAMDDLRILRVEVIERVEQLIRPGQDLIRRKRSALARHLLREIIARDELHDEKLTVALGKMVADSRKRGMMQPRQESCLTFKLLAQTFIGKQRLFQRHCRIESLIDGLVNCAHSALPELTDDAIPALQDCFWRQH